MSYEDLKNLQAHDHMCVQIFFGLNMFLVPIKLGRFKFSPYLILIVLLVPNFFFLH